MCNFEPFLLKGQPAVGVSQCTECGALTNYPPEMKRYKCLAGKGVNITVVTPEGCKVLKVIDPPKPRKPRTDCRHLGVVLRHQACETCQGEVKIKVLACGLHDECTIGKQLGELACCGACKDYVPLEKLLCETAIHNV